MGQWQLRVMMRSTRRNVLFFVVVVALGLPFAFFFAKPSVFWVLVALTSLNITIWFALALAQLVNRVRFGERMTLDEILEEKDPIRMVRLIRYHLGWSPGKITGELNQRGIENDGLPWRDHEIRRITKGVRGVL